MTSKTETVDFFISYAKADRRWAEWIAWTLKKAGYLTKIQAWDFGIGSSFVHEMDQAVQHSARTVAVLSAAYLESQYTEAEWQPAWAADPQGKERKLLVFRIEDCDRPGLLGQVVSGDLFGVEENVATTRVLDAARKKGGQPSTKPTFPGNPAPSFPGLSPRDGGGTDPPASPIPAPAPRTRKPRAVRAATTFDKLTSSDTPSGERVAPTRSAEPVDRSGHPPTLSAEISESTVSRWTWIRFFDRSTLAACRTLAGMELTSTPGNPRGSGRVAVSGDGRVLASVVESNLIELAWVNRYTHGIRLWASIRLTGVGASVRILAVGRRAEVGAMIVVADDDATWIVKANPNGMEVLEHLSPTPSAGAAIVRGTVWTLHNGRLTTPTRLGWSPPPNNIIDVDVAGTLGREVVALLVRTGRKKVVQLINDPMGNPMRLEPTVAPAKATDVRLVRETDPGRRPSSFYVDIGPPPKRPSGPAGRRIGTRYGS